jgi:hypothetical protein
MRTLHDSIRKHTTLTPCEQKTEMPSVKVSQFFHGFFMSLAILASLLRQSMNTQEVALPGKHGRPIIFLIKDDHLEEMA